MTPELTLRPVEPDDHELLVRIYGSTRADELALVDWTDEQKDAFVRQQFHAQDVYYRANYEGASYEIILADGAPAGRLYLARWPDEIRIMDIALLPEYRNLGIGTLMLQKVMEEAGRTGKKVSIHVEQYNPAQRLYLRLGFQPRGQVGVYYRMEWQSQGATD